MAEISFWKKSSKTADLFFLELTNRLQSKDRIEYISAALSLMEAAYDGCILVTNDMVVNLMGLLNKVDAPAKEAAAWALGWMCKDPVLNPKKKAAWAPSDNDVKNIISALNHLTPDDFVARKWLLTVLGRSKSKNKIVKRILIDALRDPTVVDAAINSLGELGNKNAVKVLLKLLHDPSEDVIASAIDSLARLNAKSAAKDIVIQLNSPSKKVVSSAMRAINHLKYKLSVEHIERFLWDSNLDVKMAAISALHNIKSKKSTDALSKLLEMESEGFIKSYISDLLRLNSVQVKPEL